MNDRACAKSANIIENNAKRNEEEFRRRAVCLKSYPQVVFLELSRKCDLACWMCHRHSLARSSRVNMCDRLIDSMLRDVLPAAKIVDLHGLGESTLHPRFNEVARLVAAGGGRVRLVSNLNNVSRETLSTLAEIDALVCFSLSASAPERYERIYTGGHFDRLIRNLRVLQAMRRERSTCKDMYCVTMLYEPNLDDLSNVIQLVSEFDVRRLHVTPMFLEEGDRRSVRHHMHRWCTAILAAFELADKLGVEVRVIDWPEPPKGSRKVLSNFGCHRPWSHVTVNADGRLGLCDYNEDVSMMAPLDLNHMSFAEAWNHEIYQQVRERFRAGVAGGVSTFCGDICPYTKYVDFDDDVWPELRSRVLSNRQRNL